MTTRPAALALMMLCGSTPAAAQQAHVNLDWNPHKNTQSLAPFGANLISPEVKDDRTVTFRLRAPEARSVALTGGPILLAIGKGNTAIPFERDPDGLWTLTVGPLEPNLYIYKLLVDGVAVVDPNNTITGFADQPGYSTVVVHGDGPALLRREERAAWERHAPRVPLERSRRRAGDVRLHAARLRPQPAIPGALSAGRER